MPPGFVQHGSGPVDADNPPWARCGGALAPRLHHDAGSRADVHPDLSRPQVQSVGQGLADRQILGLHELPIGRSAGAEPQRITPVQPDKERGLAKSDGARPLDVVKDGAGRQNGRRTAVVPGHLLLHQPQRVAAPGSVSRSPGAPRPASTTRWPASAVRGSESVVLIRSPPSMPPRPNCIQSGRPFIP